MKAEFIASATNLHDLPAPAFAEIAVIGRSNVGKSSLINALLNRRGLARTSGTPGCTRGLNLFRISVGEACFDIVDLPGFGFAKRSKSERNTWVDMVRDFLTKRAGLRAILVIVDARRGPEQEEEELIRYMQHLGLSIIVVATKLDKLGHAARKSAITKIHQLTKTPTFGFSAKSKQGRELLLEEVLHMVGIGSQRTNASAP